ncbi:hypothetical protein EDB80DRAFT_16116 [Ilyonectria destructans]|nr:hypothetical protein EDB80DRAFT_16116 [Ilyonectria destructans]
MHPSAGGARSLDHHHCRHHLPHDHDSHPSQSEPTRRHAARPSISKPSGSVPTTLATAVDSPLSSFVALPQRLPRSTMGTSSRRRAWPPRLSTVSRLSTNLVLVIFLAVLAISPTTAVRIPIQNCLDESYRKSDNHPLQWVPFEIDAVFDTKNDSHNLRVIVWGNVTGSQNVAELPAAGNAYWTNDNETNGKIIRSSDLESKNAKATTLIRKVNFLSYEPWRDAVDFCESGLVNGTCPLSPVFDTTNLSMPYALPSVNATHDMFSSYAFASIDANFLIIYGDAAATDIACISAIITPDLGGLAWLLKFLPLVILLFTGFAILLSAIYSPWGSSDIFHWTSNYGRDADLLRLVTPGFGDCLQYIQFVALTGGLTLDYPGFYQPIVSQMAWSTLMFNESFVAGAPPWQSVVDGIYITNATYGLQEVGQLVGMAEVEDAWAGMMIWLCVCIASVTVLIQAGFLIQWLYRKIRNTPEEDLRAKNIPFSVGNVVRIVFIFFLLPIVALSCFQLVVAGSSPASTVGLAVVTIVLLIVFACYLFYLIIKTRPKSFLYDDLPTVLLYGPLYNTYSDEAAAYALIPVLITFIRGVAIGAVQPSGIAQVVLLAICEVIQILTIHAFRPFQSATSMNAYHTLFCSLRLITILLMVAFLPSLGVTEGQKGWIGYVILGVHGAALIFGFFLNALQTIVEVVARMLGAGGDDLQGQTRGGLSKIFGMRQLSRRVTHRAGPSRASQLSTTAMLDADDSGKSGYAMPSGRVRSESGASLGGMLAHHRQSSALDSIDAYTGMPRNMDSGSSYMPDTPGEASTFSFLPSPTAARHHPSTSITDPSEVPGPYYRPPRRRRETLNDSIHSDMPAGSVNAESKRFSQTGAGTPAESTDMGAEISRGATPAPPGAHSQLSFPPNRPDYATREVDFYYGVRGPALNADGPGRRLGTGPADPTGPVATASGWIRTMFGAKTKEKGKGFEVVRSARAPAMMARNAALNGEAPPEGIPVAMGVLRNGPIDSDDEDEPPRRSPRHHEGDLLDDNGDPQDSEPESPVAERARRSFGDDERFPREPTRALSKKPHNAALRQVAADMDLPDIPRKSSKRASGSHERQAPAPLLSLTMPGSNLSFDKHMGGSDSASQNSSRHRATLSASSRLPFERTGSQKRLSSNSSMEFPGEFTQVELQGGREERPASFGRVPHHSISKVDPLHREVDLLGSSAELVVDDPPRPRT